MTGSKYSKLCERIDDLLSTDLRVEYKSNVPGNKSTLYNRAYVVRLGAIFVDMRDSASRYSANNKILVAKIAKSFNGAVLRMLRADNCVEMGVRGNTVFALYSIVDDFDNRDLLGIAARVSSTIRLLNLIYEEKNIDPVHVGIGVSVSSGLVMKSRCSLLGDRNRIWIADAISDAVELAKAGGILVEDKRTEPMAICPLLFTYLGNDLPEGVVIKAPFVRADNGYQGDLRCRAFEEWMDNRFTR